jgi:hypothetical protein
MAGTVKDKMTDKTIKIGKTCTGKITTAGDSRSISEKTDTRLIVQTVSKGRDGIMVQGMTVKEDIRTVETDIIKIGLRTDSVLNFLRKSFKNFLTKAIMCISSGHEIRILSVAELMCLYTWKG